MSATEQKHTPGPRATDPECGDESVLGPDGFMVADCAIFSRRKNGPTEERNRAGARLSFLNNRDYQVVAE